MSKARNSKTYYYDDTEDFGLVQNEDDAVFVQEPSTPSPDAIKWLYETLLSRRDFDRIRELFGDEAFENAQKQAADQRTKLPAKKPPKVARKNVKRKIETENEEQAFESPSNLTEQPPNVQSNASAAPPPTNGGQSRMSQAAQPRNYVTQAFVTPRRTISAVTQEAFIDMVSTTSEVYTNTTNVQSQTVVSSSSITDETKIRAVSSQEVLPNCDMQNPRDWHGSTPRHELPPTYSTTESSVNPFVQCPSPLSPAPVRSKDNITVDDLPKSSILAPAPPPSLSIVEGHWAKDVMSLPIERNPPDEFSDFPACYFLHDVLFV